MDLQKFQQERKYLKDISESDDGQEATIAGWIYDLRDLGKIRFILLRDITGEMQVVGFKGETDEKVLESMNKVTRESAVIITGTIKKSPKAPGGREIAPKTFEIVGQAEQPLPIDTTDFSKTELPKLLDSRFLDFHRKKTQAIFKIQGTLSESFREHFYRKGFIEMQPPCVIGAASEGGTDLFEVKYFEKKAYLAQSPQLYKQMMACSMEKTFMITPVWRAEKHNTVRHINEIRQMDIEMGFADQFAVMKQLEEVVKDMVKSVIENNKADLDLLNVQLKVPDAKYLHYDETIDLLNKNGIKVDKGDDLNPEAEKKLGELFPDTIVFVHSWPANIKPFYIMPKDGKADAEYSEGFDALYKGLEITSGGQRIHLPDLLIARIKGKGLNPESFKDYIDSFRYGAPPHGGWSIGLERMTILICGLDNIREGTMFPRDRDRITP
jgi:nondiscriminating aspartyl-tRNA synthetase